MLQKLKDFMMPIAMLLGAVFYEVFVRLAFLTPYLIFFMLLFIFSKLSPKGIRYSRLHFILLAIQLGTGILAYFLINHTDPILAQGTMICFLAPTATSAAVITHMIGGDMKFLTSYTLLSNLGVAIVAPLFFSLGGIKEGLTFWHSFFDIFIKVFPLLILPLITAWVIRGTMPRLQERMLKLSKMPFYLWSFALVVVTGRTVRSLVYLDTHNIKMEISLAVIALAVCSLQFFLGKRIGQRYGNRIAGGQSLGQKNTILAIWMSQTFLNPVSALAPSAYIIWQNIINSYQLFKKSRHTNPKN